MSCSNLKVFYLISLSLYYLKEKNTYPRFFNTHLLELKIYFYFLNSMHHPKWLAPFNRLCYSPYHIQFKKIQLFLQLFLFKEANYLPNIIFFMKKPWSLFIHFLWSHIPKHFLLLKLITSNIDRFIHLSNYPKTILKLVNTNKLIIYCIFYLSFVHIIYFVNILCSITPTALIYNSVFRRFSFALVILLMVKA